VSTIARSLWGSVALIVVLMTAACGSGGNPVDKNLTWQDAKAATQKKELDIAALFPKDQVVKVDQRPKGVLMPCKQEGTYNWQGGTAIILTPSTPHEPLIRMLEAHYKDSRFTPITDHDINGDLEVQLYDPKAHEAYIIGSGFHGPDSMDITSFSPCFVLPEDTWPGGDF